MMKVSTTQLIDVTNMNPFDFEFLLLTQNGKQDIHEDSFGELGDLAGKMTYKQMKKYQRQLGEQWEAREVMYDAWCYYNEAGSYNRNKKFAYYLNKGDVEGAILAEQAGY